MSVKKPSPVGFHQALSNVLKPKSNGSSTHVTCQAFAFELLEPDLQLAKKVEAGVPGWVLGVTKGLDLGLRQNGVLHPEMSLRVIPGQLMHIDRFFVSDDPY